jgi:hypothetical protein
LVILLILFIKINNNYTSNIKNFNKIDNMKITTSSKNPLFKMSLTNFNSSFFDNNFSTYRSYTNNSNIKIKNIPHLFLTREVQETNYTNNPSSRLSTIRDKEKSEKLPKITKRKIKKNQMDKESQNIIEYLHNHYYNNEKMYEMEKYKEDENYYGDKVNKELNRRKKKYKGIHQDINQIKKSSELISVIFNYVSPVFEKEKFKKLLDEYKKKIQKKHNKNYLTIDYINTPSKIYVPSLYRIKYNQKY